MNQPRRSSRRAFLTGRAAADGLADRLAGGPSGESAPPSGSESWTPEETPLIARDPTQTPYLFRLGRRAMACEFQLFFNAGQYGGATDQGLAALDCIDRLEAQLTIYRPDSEVSEMNRRAADAPFRLEQGLYQLLERGKQISEATAGAFDYTSGPLSEAWGFARRQGRVPDDAALREALATVGSRHVELDPYERTATFTRTGVQINLGGIGKGYALDEAGWLLEQSGVRDFVFHGGNSSVLARGHRAGTSGWNVGLVHPLRPEQRLGELILLDRALSTSGSGTQFFHFGGRRYGHLIDPRSGRPAEGVLSATVLAPTAAEADALSTALYVLSRDEVAQFCAARPEIGALLVYPSAAAGGIELVTFNLDDTVWKQVAAR